MLLIRRHQEATPRSIFPKALSTQEQKIYRVNAKGVDLSVFVNELLKKGIELIQMGR